MWGVAVKADQPADDAVTGLSLGSPVHVGPRQQRQAGEG